jgi:hypothetical protein
MRKSRHNEKAEWIRKEGKEKIRNMNWTLLRVTKTTSFLSVIRDWESSESDKYQTIG